MHGMELYVNPICEEIAVSVIDCDVHYPFYAQMKSLLKLHRGLMQKST